VSDKREKQPVKSKSQNHKKLDWDKFNFLENLLIFCTVPNGNAPPESGVEFRINSPASDDIVCILFKIDRDNNDPLITSDEVRPDYMAFYTDEEVCVCTIIEMKGTAENRLEHGIEQIKKFRDKLRSEIKERLPNRFSSRLKFQGILLSPPNSQVPLKKLTEEAKRGFRIHSLMWDKKAELFKYVSKFHDGFVRYEHKPDPHEEEHGFIEGVLVEQAMNYRKNDNYHTANFVANNNQRGVYINYELEDNRVYAALCLDNQNKSECAIKENGNEYNDKVKECLEKLGITNPKSLKIVKID